MDFNDTAVSLFNESDSYFNLLVFESQDSEIYQNVNKSLISGKLQDINYKVVTVEEIVLIDSDYYYKINYLNKIKGFFKPNESIVIIPKAREQVKLDPSLEFNNKLNNYLSLSNSLFEEAGNKIAFSTSYAIFKGKVFEVVVYKNEIVGVFYSEKLDHLIKYTVDFTIGKNSKIYKDSSLKTQLSILNKTASKFRSEFVIPTKKLVRFRDNGIIKWVPVSSTDINYVKNNFRPTNASDTLIKSLLYQYKDKLRKSHSLSLEIMNKEIKKIKGE